MLSQGGGEKDTEKIPLFAFSRKRALRFLIKRGYPRGTQAWIPFRSRLEAIAAIVHREQRLRNCEAVTMHGIAVVLYSTNQPSKAPVIHVATRVINMFGANFVIRFGKLKFR